jgi:hypothetical protein
VSKKKKGRKKGWWAPRHAFALGGGEEIVLGDVRGEGIEKALLLE